MRITCMNGHDVCTFTDVKNKVLHANNFVDWAEEQTPVHYTDRIWHIASLLLSDDHLPGKCWCGAAWGGADHNHRYVLHTAEGWWPKFDEG